MGQKKSEFGKGLTYCLGLFLAHEERAESYSPDLWFNGASDHLYELQIPETLPVRLAGSLRTFRDKVLYWGHAFKDKATEKDKAWALAEVRELLRKVDEAYGVKTQKGEYE